MKDEFEAGQLAGRAADRLHAALNPGDQLGSGPRTDLPGGVADATDRAMKVAAEAQGALDVDLGRGRPNPTAGIPKLEEALRLLPQTSGAGLPADFVAELDDARALLDAALDEARTLEV
jgi:hypothetical protein